MSLFFYITGIRIIPPNFRTFSLFIAIYKTSPSTRSVTAAIRVWKNVDILGNRLLS